MELGNQPMNLNVNVIVDIAKVVKKNLIGEFEAVIREEVLYGLTLHRHTTKGFKSPKTL